MTRKLFRIGARVTIAGSAFNGLEGTVSRDIGDCPHPVMVALIEAGTRWELWFRPEELTALASGDRVPA